MIDVCKYCGSKKKAKQRSIRQIRMYFKLLDLILPHQTFFKNKEMLHKAIKEALGYVEPYYDLNGMIAGYETQSIAIHKMKQEEFNNYIKEVLDLIFEKIIPNADEKLEREICNVIGVFRE